MRTLDIQGWERLRPGARVREGAPGQVHGRAGLRGPCRDRFRRGPRSGLAAAADSKLQRCRLQDPDALRELSAGSPPACHYHRRLQGILLGPRLANKNTLSKTGHKKEKWPGIPLLGSPFKATGRLLRGPCSGGHSGGWGMKKTLHWLMGAEKYPRTPLHFSSPSPFPDIPHHPGLLADTFPEPQ